MGEEPETGHWVPFGYSQGKEVALQGVVQDVLLDRGAASVLVLEAMVSPCCRLGLCCCAEAEQQGARWHAALEAVGEEQRSCASCRYRWWCWGERGPVRRVSASEAVLGGKLGCSRYHREDARWLQTPGALEQQLGNWGLAELAYQL